MGDGGGGGGGKGGGAPMQQAPAPVQPPPPPPPPTQSSAPNLENTTGKNVEAFDARVKSAEKRRRSGQDTVLASLTEDDGSSILG